MLAPRSVSSTVYQIERDIAEAERLIHEKVQFIIALLRIGLDTIESENRVCEMRAGLELLYAQRRKLIQVMHEQPSSAGTRIERAP
jgi:hypothetical protein